MNVMEIKNLSIGFKRILFQEINASLKEGSFVGLLGINGVGKSCLIKTLSHLLEGKSGEILLHGREIQTIKPAELSKKIAVVLTEKLQIDYLSVFELVSFGRAPYTARNGHLSKEDVAIVDSALEQTGIKSLSQKYFSELSDGQKQKALIARALAQKPQILFLDEPTTYLDIPSKLDLIDLLRKLTKENNLAVLLSTHDLELIKDKVDEFWLMGKDGKFSTGSPEVMMTSGLIGTNFFRSGSR